MGIYLLDNRPARSQWSARTKRPTGLIVIHTTESVLDSSGPDTGAESVAKFIRSRTTPGCYHDLVDADSVVQMAPYEQGAYHDGTGSNPFSLSISFALSAKDWPTMSGHKVDAFLRNGAHAFAKQQAWLRNHGYPATPVRRVTKAQSSAGAAGLISHGERDPGRRSDPGPRFPWDRFMQLCREAIGAGAAPAVPQVEGPAPAGGSLLKRGATGPAVRKLQDFMTKTFPSYNGYTPNGTFGPATETGIREFQKRVGLGADGIVGPNTLAKLRAYGYTG